MLPGMQSLKKDDVIETRVQMNAILNPTLGNMVEVCGTIVEVTSQFLYKGTYTGYESTFQKKDLRWKCI